MDIRKRRDLWCEPRALLTLGNSVKAAREVLALSVLVRVRVPQLRVENEGAYPNRQRDHAQTVAGVCSYLTVPTSLPDLVVEEDVWAGFESSRDHSGPAHPGKEAHREVCGKRA